MFKWRKLGLLYSPSNTKRSQKLLTHAANPLPVLIDGNVFRVFYSGRDACSRSSVGAVDIDIVTRAVIEEHPDPFFEHGNPDSFYGSGVSIGNCYDVNGVNYMLFMGWQNAPGLHWRGDIGRLVLKSDLTLEIDKEEPFIGADTIDPISVSYPWVVQNQDDSYSMWYGSTESWDGGNGEMVHVIKSASSVDGEQWVKHGLALPFTLGVAQAFSRPTVARNMDGSSDMWFSYRSGSGETYRIGHAVSKNTEDGAWVFTEDDITVSSHGWDSQMIEYPFVFDHGGDRYMLYNGNGYGATGFGLAIQERV